MEGYSLRNRIVGVLVVFASLGLLVSAAVADIQYRVMVNGKVVQSDVPPLNVQGRLLLPVRAVAEAMGAQVEYDAATYTAVITTRSSEGTLSATQQKELLDLNELRARVNQNAQESLSVILAMTYTMESPDAAQYPAKFTEYWDEAKAWGSFNTERLVEVKYHLAFSPEVSRMLEQHAAGAETPDKLKQRIDMLWADLEQARLLLASARLEEMGTVLSGVREEYYELVYSIAAYDAAIMSRTDDLIGALGRAGQ